MTVGLDLRTEFHYVEMLKVMKVKKPSLQANQLAMIFGYLYARQNEIEGKLSAHCKKKGVDFYATMESITANWQLEEVNRIANRFLNLFLGTNHGICIAKEGWKEEKVSFFALLVRIKSLLGSVLETSAKKLGCRVIAQKFELLYSDARTGQAMIANHNNIDCLIYALYRLRENQEMRAIFIDKISVFLGRSSLEQLQTFIDKWGYRLVDRPQKGDLIVYLNRRDMFVHAGVMVDEKMVHSKWGKYMNEILEHPIDFVPKTYGCTYVFYRKEGAALDQPWVV